MRPQPPLPPNGTRNRYNVEAWIEGEWRTRAQNMTVDSARSRCRYFVLTLRIPALLVARDSKGRKVVLP